MIMRPRSLPALLALAALLACSRVATAGDAGRFFPTRPAGIATQTAMGVLTDFGIGNSSGTLTLHTGGGDRTFYVAEKVTLDGKPVACDHPPENGATASPVECPSWPTNVVIGKTRVRVTYWAMKRPDSGENVQVTDRIMTQGAS